MTDDEKVLKMFGIRKNEVPHLLATMNDAEPNLFNKAFRYYDSMLKMYNDRYENKGGSHERDIKKII